jgi:O-6-methylguanine DNA methyltransferase
MMVATMAHMKTMAYAADAPAVESVCLTPIPSPIGALQAYTSARGLCALEFPLPERAHRLRGRFARWFDGARVERADTDLHARVRSWLARYFDAEFPPHDELPLDLRGTPFEQRVWKALLAIPPGRTTTYGDLARRLGGPSVARAVGGAVGRNPIGIIVPCHRVVGSTGSLTGFGGGLDRKAWLLRHEKPDLLRY